jgi:hypothetical protein
MPVLNVKVVELEDQPKSHRQKQYEGKFSRASEYPRRSFVFINQTIDKKDITAPDQWGEIGIYKWHPRK